jgi:hypothetical protein
MYTLKCCNAMFSSWLTSITRISLCQIILEWKGKVYMYFFIKIISFFNLFYFIYLFVCADIIFYLLHYIKPAILAWIGQNCSMVFLKHKIKLYHMHQTWKLLCLSGTHAKQLSHINYQQYRYTANFKQSSQIKHDEKNIHSTQNTRANFK